MLFASCHLSPLCPAAQILTHQLSSNCLECVTNKVYGLLQCPMPSHLAKKRHGTRVNGWYTPEVIVIALMTCDILSCLAFHFLFLKHKVLCCVIIPLVVETPIKKYSRIQQLHLSSVYLKFKILYTVYTAWLFNACGTRAHDKKSGQWRSPILRSEAPCHQGGCTVVLL